MAKRHNAAILWQLPADLVGHLRSEAHQSRWPTYRALRKAYALSRGRSRRAIRSLFRILRPVERKLTVEANNVLSILKRDGIARVPNFVAGEQVARIKAFLRAQEHYPVGRLKRQYRAEDLLESGDIRSLIEDRFIQDLAAVYLGCVPIFTQVNAWWSIRAPDATTEDLSNAAQQYHYDYDWAAFVKFFIYLTDVGPDNGPFTYVLGTHERKLDWRDGRLDEEYIVANYGSKRKAMTGRAGDLIAADTVGYHKGERVQGSPRLMLQLEFAVSRLGASCQYQLLPSEKRPASNFSKTFDVFSR